MNDHKEVECAHHPKLHRFVTKGDEPKEQGDHRNVEEDKGTPRRVIGHGAQHKEETPFVLMNSVEFVSEQRRKREVEEEVEHVRCRVNLES